MNYKAEFKKGIKKGAFSKYKNNAFKPDDLVLFESAVSQGYDDAKRTFTNIGKFWQEHPEFRKDFFKIIAQKIQEVFNEFPAEGFDCWHKVACDLFLRLLKEKGYKNVTYGQAQKVINMAFKYLYCLDGAEEYNEVFDSCHMPLDSFTLEWFKREIVKDQKGIKIGTWSSMKNSDDPAEQKDDKGYQTYNYYAEEIQKYCEKTENKPLFLEFKIWPEIQKHLATEAFLFSLKEAITAAEKAKIRAKSLREKLKEIEEDLNNWK